MDEANKTDGSIKVEDLDANAVRADDARVATCITRIGQATLAVRQAEERRDRMIAEFLEAQRAMRARIEDLAGTYGVDLGAGKWVFDVKSGAFRPDPT